MAVRGNIAKSNIEAKLKEVFGGDYIGKDGGKIYIMADDGGEKVQIAIAMTCPKTPLNVIDTKTLSYQAGRDFTQTDYVVVKDNTNSNSEEEQKKAKEMLDRLMTERETIRF
jgi:hypothetical protein